MRLNRFSVSLYSGKKAGDVLVTSLGDNGFISLTQLPNLFCSIGKCLEDVDSIRLYQLNGGIYLRHQLLVGGIIQLIDDFLLGFLGLG